MRSVSLLGLLFLVGCGQSAPSLPSHVDGPSPSDPTSLVEPDRDLAGTITGAVTLNGSSTTDPSYEEAPFALTQTGRVGDIALLTLQPQAIPSASNSVLAQFSGATTSYGSLPYISNNATNYIAIYMTKTEPMSVTLNNTPIVGGPLHSQAVRWNYTFKTTPREDGGENNDDENPATITDRTLGGTLPVGSTFNRSMFQKTAVTNQDQEDWYKITLAPSSQYRLATTNSNGTWGTWRYNLKLYTAAGTLIASRIGYTATSNEISLTTTAGGTFYVQLTGTPLSRKGASVYFTQYSLSLALTGPAIPVVTAVSPSGSAGIAYTERRFSVAATNSPTSWTWNFGGGATPNTSTLATPDVELGPPGTYTGTVRAGNAQGLSEVFSFIYAIGNPIPPPWVSDYLPAGAGTNAGYNSQLVLYNGKPAIAYQDGDDHLWLAIAQNPTPTADQWTITSVEPTRDLSFALIVFNGKLVVVYHDNISTETRLTRATVDAPVGPASWTSHTVVSTNTVGQMQSLITYNGKLAFTYFDLPTNSLRVAQATITTPAAAADWQTHSVVVNAEAKFSHDLAEIGGKLAIAHRSPGLVYRPALVVTPTSQTDWNSVGVDQGPIQFGIDLVADHAGNPAMAYFGSDGSESRARVARGDTPSPHFDDWTIISINPDADVALYGSIDAALVDGRLIVTYFSVVGTTGFVTMSRAVSPVTTGSEDWVSQGIQGNGIDYGPDLIALADGNMGIAYPEQIVSVGVRQRFARATWSW